MATLSKHGEKLTEIERLASKIAYMSDGTILRNHGDGWKLWRKVKPGVDVAAHAKERAESYEKFLMERPAFAAYREALHKTVCFSQRYLVKEVLSMFANDPDGVWSELNDMANVPIDVDECVELCGLHEAASAETKTYAGRSTNRGVKGVTYGN